MALTKIDDRGLKTPIDLQDNENIRLGTGNDLQIYHDGSHNYILSSNGHVHLVGDGTNQVKITAKNNEQGILITPNGSVELYYDNSKKFETTSSGIKVTGDASTGTIIQGAFTLRDTSSSSDRIKWIPNSPYVLRWSDNFKASFGSGDDLQIYHNGVQSFIDNSTGRLKIRSNAVKISNLAEDHTYILTNEDGSSHDVKLYYDNSKKFETTSGGARILDNLQLDADNRKAIFGSSNDLQLYHDGTHSYIYNTTGELKNRAAIWKVVNAANSEIQIKATENAAVELYYDNVKKFETTSYGTRTTGYHTQSSNVGFQGDAADWTSSTPYMHNMALQWNSGHFVNSTGVFTCPVAGKYLCSASVQAHRANNPSGSNGQYYNVIWQKNNSNYHTEMVGTVATDASALSTSAVNGKHETITATVIIDCAANDTIRAHSNHGYRNNSQNICSVYLLG